MHAILLVFLCSTDSLWNLARADEPAPAPVPAPVPRSGMPPGFTFRSPPPLPPGPVDNLPPLRRLTGGESTTCGEAMDGALWCWGGRAGVADRVAAHPTLTSAGSRFPECHLDGALLRCPTLLAAAAMGPGFDAVALTEDRSGTICASDGARTTRCLYELHTTEDPMRWVPLPGLGGAVELVALASGICGRTADGEVACWRDPEPDDGVPPVSRKAKPVPGLAGAVELAAAGDLVCARDTTGAVRCVGQLGFGHEWFDSKRAVEVPGLAGATAIHAGAWHVCGVVDGQVRCFGEGGYGALGPGYGKDGEPMGSREPVPIALPGPAIDVAAGSFHTCALLATGAAWCWGTGGEGRLGRITRTGVPPVAPPPTPAAD